MASKAQTPCLQSCTLSSRTSWDKVFQFLFTSKIPGEFPKVPDRSRWVCLHAPIVLEEHLGLTIKNCLLCTRPELEPLPGAYLPWLRGCFHRSCFKFLTDIKTSSSSLYHHKDTDAQLTSGPCLCINTKPSNPEDRWMMSTTPRAPMVGHCDLW